MRRVEFQIGEYYHIFNRGVDQREIFCDQYDFGRFIRGMREFNRVEAIESLYRLDYLRSTGQEAKPPIGGLASTRLVEMICYSLLSNHYHFLIKQSEDRGIEKFMHKLGTSYTMYFNNKYNRSGSLFQGPYKSIHIKTNENLLRLSSYINGNSEVHGICPAEKWQWGSYQDYLNIRQGDMCDKEVILDQFKNINEYSDYTDFVIKESRQAKLELKKYYLE